mgnify:CR=1 FL=1
MMEGVTLLNLDLLPSAAAILGAVAAGLYGGVLLPRLGGSRPAWKLLRNLEDFRSRFGREGPGSTLWMGFLLISTTALLLGLAALTLQVRSLATW